MTGIVISALFGVFVGVIESVISIKKYGNLKVCISPGLLGTDSKAVAWTAYGIPILLAAIGMILSCVYTLFKAPELLNVGVFMVTTGFSALIIHYQLATRSKHQKAE